MHVTYKIRYNFFFPQNITRIIRELLLTFTLRCNLVFFRMHIKFETALERNIFRELVNFLLRFYRHSERLEFSRTIRENDATDTVTRTHRAFLITRCVYQAVVRFTHVIRYDAERVMSTWKNLCPGRLGSKVTSDIIGREGI